MGKVKWDSGLSASTFDKAERGQFDPYMGPPVPNGVYCWRVKRVRLGKSSGGHKQFIFGLELTPRRSRPAEKEYKGYYLTDYQVVTEGRAGFIAQLLDALGVTGRDLLERTVTRGEKDERGSFDVAKIGNWENNGKQYVMAGLVDGTDKDDKPRKEIKGYWAIPEDSSASSSDDDDDDEDEDNYDEDQDSSEDDEEEDDEEERKPAKKAAKKSTSKRRQEEDDEDSDDGDDEEEDRKPAKKAAKKAAPKKSTAKKSRRDADEDDADDDEPPF